jgi:hypothetical protein
MGGGGGDFGAGVCEHAAAPANTAARVSRPAYDGAARGATLTRAPQNGQTASVRATWRRQAEHGSKLIETKVLDSVRAILIFRSHTRFAITVTATLAHTSTTAQIVDDKLTEDANASRATWRMLALRSLARSAVVATAPAMLCSAS